LFLDPPSLLAYGFVLQSIYDNQFLGVHGYEQL
jgi:hypothetical protein